MSSYRLYNGATALSLGYRVRNVKALIASGDKYR